MKIKDLIEKLQQFDPDMEVVVDGYETGYDYVKEIYKIPVIPTPDGKGWYDGELQDSDIKPISWLQDIEEVIYLPRRS